MLQNKSLKNNKKDVLITIVSVLVLISSVLYLVNSYTFTGNVTPIELLTVTLLQLSISIVLGCGFLCGSFTYVDSTISKLLITAFIASMIFLVVITILESTLVIYYDECEKLDNVTTTHIFEYDCINYAIDNPHSTGTEIINHFKQKADYIQINNILDRPLIP